MANPDGSIQKFIDRVLSYVALRITSLGNKVDLSKSLQDKAWTVLKYLFVNVPELLYKRHLDQVILCAIYGAARPSEALSFVTLVEQYLALFKVEQHMVKEVYLQGEEYTDIIGFYNRSFRVCLLYTSPSPRDS